MIVGEVYFFISNRARGHDTRAKYHVYVGEGNWREQGHAFLFINSSNITGDAYEINQENYAFLTLPVSYIDGLICYEADYLRDCNPVRVGKISDAHLGEIYR